MEAHEEGDLWLGPWRVNAITVGRRGAGWENAFQAEAAACTSGCVSKRAWCVSGARAGLRG